MEANPAHCTTGLDQLATIPRAAKQLGIPEYALRRAVELELVPTDRSFSTRKLVRPAEVLAAMSVYRKGCAA